VERLSRRTCPPILWFSSDLRPRTSIGAGMKSVPGRQSPTFEKKVRHPALRWMRATLDGRVEGNDAVFEAKFMLPWSFSEEAAAEKHMPQLQHNMWVVAARTAVLSVITGGGKWVEIVAHADPLYQHLIVTAERKFWRCVESHPPGPSPWARP
jgi:predicted phage-related endonuclease